MKTVNLNLLFAALLFLSTSLLAPDPFRVSIKNAEYDAEKNQLKVEVPLATRVRERFSF